MHERNIYKIPPNFAELAKKFDFFAPFLTLDEGGIPRINFKDPCALRALSKALLLRDFGLDVIIPENALTPTVPLRLNYILWIEDLILGLIQCSGSPSTVRGIDIGTGATAIYALLGARKNGWNMTGTEIHGEYVEVAKQNVERNKLEELITIVPTKPGESLSSLLASRDTDIFTFSLCNPPFFTCDEETDSVAKAKKPLLRPPPSAAKTGQSTELVVEGGELQFVQNMIKDSLLHPKKVLIYTTMLGIRRHLKILINFLRTNHIPNYTTTEFIQGKTMRWGLAWSFCVNLLPPKPDLVASFPNFSPLVNFETLIGSYLSDLKFHTFAWLPSTSDDVGVEQPVLEIVATENTWSNQRKKRRLEKRMQELGCSSPKIAKMEEDATDSAALASSSMEVEPQKEILLHAFLDFVREEEDGTSAKILMRFREGSLGKEGLHQIMQYIKNRYDKDSKDPTNPVFQLSSN